MPKPRQVRSSGGGRPTRARQYDKAGAQERVIELLQRGSTVKSALEEVGRSQKAWEQWRRESEGKADGFKARTDQARALREKRDESTGERLGFAEWREKYLEITTPWHQLQWVDMLEGRDPRDLHKSQTFSPGKRGRQLILTPPFHGKSVAITIDYVTYRLCLDPSFRVLIVSASATLAKDFLFGIKQRLTSPDFIELQKAYAPEGGWEATAESWAEDRIVFGTDVRSQGAGRGRHEKDPNCQALGVRGHIYGKRADLIICDDTVDGNNVREWEKQMKWLRREVSSRLEAGGKLVVIGTRIAPVDLYSELLNPEHYANGKVPWTHLASPAILEEGQSPEQHITLWPESEMPWVPPHAEDDDECLCGGLPYCKTGREVDGTQFYPRWDGIHLEAGPRADNNASEWALVYQQKATSENAVFPEHAVQRSINKQRLPGLLQRDKLGHPLTGMHEKYVVAGLDPSIKGWAGIIVLAVDVKAQKVYLLNAINLKGPTPDALKQEMYRVTELYDVDEWMVENTGLLQFFTQDSELRQWMAMKGVLFTEHTTGAHNKWDPAYGVASMGPLFGQYRRNKDNHGNFTGEWETVVEPIIELPRLAGEGGLKALVNQLVTWTPDTDPKKTPCDLVMALWFAAIKARTLLRRGNNTGRPSPFKTNRFVSPRARRGATTVNIADFRAAQQ